MGSLLMFNKGTLPKNLLNGCNDESLYEAVVIL